MKYSQYAFFLSVFPKDYSRLPDKLVVNAKELQGMEAIFAWMLHKLTQRYCSY